MYRPLIPLMTVPPCPVTIRAQACWFNSSFRAPTAGFVFGQQQRDIWGRDNGVQFAQDAADENWLVENSRLNTMHAITHNQTISGRATLEPMKDFRVDLTLNRTFSARIAMNSSVGMIPCKFTNRKALLQWQT
jgi:cell surface protein SprA